MTSRRALALLAAAAAVVLWVLAARALWPSTVPGGLKLPHVPARSFASAAELHRARSYDRFLWIDALLAALVQITVLAGYARRGHVLMRESAAGRIGTGMLLGMLGLAFVWLAQLPFGIAGLWWERRHHISHQGYLGWVVANFLGLGGVFLFVSIALAIVMGLARPLRGRWWLAGAPVFVALTALFYFVQPYLIPEVHRLHNPALAADARSLARAEGVGGVGVYVQDVHRFTTAPNAEAAGLGPSRRVILWDTLLEHDRFRRREVRVVLAHEFGHHAHDDLARDIGWFALFAFPAAFAIALVTRRRGGMARPEAVPVALLTIVALQIVTTPLQNIRTRHVEAAADWAALQTTRDPVAARELFAGLARSAHADPDPPMWAYVLFADHPTTAQRLAMIEAWTARGRR